MALSIGILLFLVLVVEGVESNPGPPRRSPDRCCRSGRGGDNATRGFFCSPETGFKMQRLLCRFSSDFHVNEINMTNLLLEIRKDVQKKKKKKNRKK